MQNEPMEVYSTLCSFEIIKLGELLNKEDNIKKFQSIKVRMLVDGDLVLVKFFCRKQKSAQMVSSAHNEMPRGKQIRRTVC